MRDFRAELRDVYNFTCSYAEDSEGHKCIFNFIEDCLKEIDHLRYYGPRVL